MSERKHVLMISTDHWFAPLMGCAGHPVVMTPTLDQLARDGIRFTNCFSTCPVRAFRLVKKTAKYAGFCRV